jgi:endoglucanase
MDYLLGNNPLDQSYVTGYGARPLEHPHHRFFAHQSRPDRPEPPPGLVSGGPNSGLQDPIARGAGLQGKAPQRCFIDHIGAYSVNEVAINWNAPLAWVAAFLDDTANTH